MHSQVDFKIDTTPPIVSVYPIENKTYAEYGVPLFFNLNESVSKISYFLDGMDNITIDGNTTLSGLSKGEHTVTVFAWDSAGNVSRSENISFTLSEPFTDISVAVYSAALVTVA